MDYEKITVIPQITIYKNILKNCDDIINFLKEDYDKDSVFTEWNDWYHQGSLKRSQFNKKNIIQNDDDSFLIKKEKEILKRISDVYDFVRNDYLEEYSNEKGTWPKYITDWEKLNKEPNFIDLNIYKYSNKKGKNINPNKLAMQYHYDEMPTDEMARKEHCLITITFYINDEYDGGEICFYDESSNKAYKYKPKAGDVTIFPSGKPYYHGVSEYFNSDRYFMRTFVLYQSDGEKEWLEKYELHGDNFIQEEKKKTEKFIQDAMHNVTLVFPGEKIPDKIYGKLIHLDEKIIEIK